MARIIANIPFRIDRRAQKIGEHILNRPKVREMNSSVLRHLLQG